MKFHPPPLLLATLVVVATMIGCTWWITRHLVELEDLAAHVVDNTGR